MTNGVMLSVVLVCALLLTAACGGNARVPADGSLQSAQLQPGLREGLPSPSELAVALPRAASYTEADLLLEGSDYEPGLPSSNVSLQGDSALFSPAFIAGSALQDSAYGIYHFEVPGYDRNPELRIDRSINPAAYADSYVALADWERDRWVWFADEPDGRLDLGSMEPYLSESGDVLVVMLATGSAAFDLTSLRLGALAPQAALSASVEEGAAPLSVEFDASASLSIDGSIVKYEWDPEGDGVFETDSADVAQHQFEYLSNGQYTAQVRVTSSFGISSVASVVIDVNDFWEHTFSLGVEDIFDDCIIAPDGTAYFAGSCVRAVGAKRLLLLLRVDPGGQLAWASSFEGGDDISFAMLDIAPGGDLIVAAQLDAAVGQDCLIQRWTPQGGLVWSKVYGSASSDSVVGIDCGPNFWYLGGDSLSGGDSDLFVGQLDYDGNFIWSRRRDLGDSEYANSFTLKYVAGTALAVTLLGNQFDGTANHPWMTEWLINGDFAGGVQLDDTTSDIDCGEVRFYRPTLADTGIYYIGAAMGPPEARQALLLAIPASGQSLYGTLIPLENAGVQGMALGSDGNITLGLSCTVGADSRAALGQYSLEQGSFVAGLRSASGVNLCLGLDSLGQDLLLSGISQINSIEWEPLDPTVSNVTMSFVNAPGSGSNLALASSNYNGITTDLTDDYGIDDGASVFKGYGSFMPAI